MKNAKKKILISAILILTIISLIIGTSLYINSKEEVTTVSKNIEKPYVVTLGENNSNIVEENNRTKLIQKYN